MDNLKRTENKKPAVTVERQLPVTVNRDPDSRLTLADLTVLHMIRLLYRKYAGKSTEKALRRP